MKYTRDESGEVVQVNGCTTCPHMEKRGVQGLTEAMYCTKPQIGKPQIGKPQIGKVKTAGRKLLGQWTGAYHASCPLASDPKNVPALPEAKK